MPFSIFDLTFTIAFTIASTQKIAQLRPTTPVLPELDKAPGLRDLPREPSTTSPEMQEPQYPRVSGPEDRRDIGGNTESSGFADAPPSAPDLAPGNFAHAELPPGMNWRLVRDIGGNTESSGFADAPPSAPDLAPGNFAHAELPPGMNWRLTRDLPDTLQVPEKIASHPIENFTPVSEISKEHQSVTTVALTGMFVGCLMAMAIMYALRKIRRRKMATRAERPSFRDVETGENGNMGINGEMLAGYKSER